MKRFLFIVALAALLGQAGTAQESEEPDEESVLEVARSKYFSEEEIPDNEQPEARDGQGGSRPQARESGGERSYAPFVLSFVPGLSLPFGSYDASAAVGIVGSLAGSIQGFQCSGVFNIAEGEVEGFQGAGVFNLANGEVGGFQGAGVFNIANGGVEGFQAAGVFNIAGDAELPIQAAGVFNIAGDLEGFQAAGLFNVAGEVEGGQIAGVVNVAGDVDGVQIGLVNVADHLDGIQIGLINIARSPGLSSLGGFYEPETGYMYAALQTGSRRLYTVLSAGMPRGDWNRTARGAVAGYGLGTRLRLSPAYVDLDLSAESFVGPELPALREAIREGRAPSHRPGLEPYPSLRACLGLPLAGKLHLVGGLKVDFDLERAPRVPEALQRGRSHASELFGIEYRAWSKWYLGIKI